MNRYLGFVWKLWWFIQTIRLKQTITDGETVSQFWENNHFWDAVLVLFQRKYISGGAQSVWFIWLEDKTVKPPPISSFIDTKKRLVALKIGGTLEMDTVVKNPSVERSHLQIRSQRWNFEILTHIALPFPTFHFEFIVSETCKQTFTSMQADPPTPL